MVLLLPNGLAGLLLGLGKVTPAILPVVRAANEQLIRFFDVDRHGHGELRLTPVGVDVDFVSPTTVAEPNSPVEVLASFRLDAGNGYAGAQIMPDYDSLLGEMDMIVTSTSGAGKKILDITKVKPGCVITDVARPLDLPPSEVAKRPDVLVIESGEIDLPTKVKGLKSIGLPPNVIYACLAETITLALEGREVFSAHPLTELVFDLPPGCRHVRAGFGLVPPAYADPTPEPNPAPASPAPAAPGSPAPASPAPASPAPS